jgi:dynactin complex subunit
VGAEVEYWSGQQSCQARVHYVGPVDGKAGTYWGIELELPVGRNDGSVGGKRFDSD